MRLAKCDGKTDLPCVSRSGIGGGVVSQPYFQEHFGFANNAKRKNDISSNVVSVLQAGAFFGARRRLTYFPFGRSKDSHNNRYPAISE